MYQCFVKSNLFPLQIYICCTKRTRRNAECGFSTKVSFQVNYILQKWLNTSKYFSNVDHEYSVYFRSMSRRAFRRNHPSGGGAISSGAVPTVAEAMEFEAMDTSAPFPPPQL